MQVENNIPKNGTPKKLKDFIPLLLTFFVALFILSMYQNLSLYLSGVIDSIFNKSFFHLLLNHTGYVAITALILSFLFNYLENKKAGLGYKTTRIILILLICIEALLIQYYIQNYEILGTGILGIYKSDTVIFSLLPVIGLLLICFALCYYVQKFTAKTYTVISRMYPVTLILFSLFLATLYADKKPINENKTHHLISSLKDYALENDTYEGTAEYPLLKDYTKEDVLSTYFNIKEEKPNIIFLVVEGLGSDFIGDKPDYKGFTPYLQELTTKSLFWENHLSNSGESFAAIPNILGSLPFGEEGFTNLNNYTNRNTLYSILKKNGYATSFNYGGNSALNYIDKFLDEERVDRIIDKKVFNQNYSLQEEDAAGISLGYPDAELFKKFNASFFSTKKPRLDFFVTLSTKNPYAIPNAEKYLQLVEKQLANKKIYTKRARKIISNNKELYASLLYTDSAVKSFLENYKTKPEYKNTIFIITGTHNSTDLPQATNLQKYKVPLLLFSPLLKTPKKIKSLTSHADITPSLISFLDANYTIKVPTKNAWLGSSLVHENTFKMDKEIPLFKRRKAIVDYISGSNFISKGNVYKLYKDLDLLEEEESSNKDVIKERFRYFKSVNKYVTATNKIIPEDLSIYVTKTKEFSKQDQIWVESVFNDKDFDNAYETARDLAFNKEWDRSLLLCNYILSKIPRHADTEILVGRVYAWKKEYNNSIQVLEEVIRKYPTYEDGYAALLDVYYWSNNNDRVPEIQEIIQENNISSKEIAVKLLRANTILSKNKEIAEINF